MQHSLMKLEVEASSFPSTMNELWRALKKLPLLPRRFQCKEPSLRFVDLPEDIVYEIGHHLEVRSLCNLALTCRQLYLNLLTPHLHRLGLKDPFHEIHLNGDNCAAAIPALRLLLYDSPIKLFTWRAGDNPRTLVREVEQLRRLIARISVIEFLELDFSNTWPVHEYRYGPEHGYWAWVRLFTNLLHVVAQRCHFVVITNHYQVLVPWVTFIGGVPYNLDPPLLNRIREEWRHSSKAVSQKLLKSPSKISLSHPTTKKSGFPQPFPAEKATTTAVYATRRLIVNDPGLFQRSLFGEWALDWVNNMPLTHLVIHQGRMRLPLLRQLRLPRLVSLTISHGYGLSTSDIVQVLQNNESLSAVDFLDTKLDTSNAIVMVKKRKHSRSAVDIGCSVEQMKGPASFLRGVLDLELAYLRLKTVVVQVRGDGRSEHGHMDRLYKSLAGRESISSLVFEFPAPCERRGVVKLDSWLAAAIHKVPEGRGSGLKGATEGLQHIRTVHLQYLGTSDSTMLTPEEEHGTPIKPDLSALLVAWASSFPSLGEIRFTNIFHLRDDQQPLLVVAHQISPKVTVRVDGAVYQHGRIGWDGGGSGVRTHMERMDFEAWT